MSSPPVDSNTSAAGVELRPGRIDDAPGLSEIARASKAHWGYSEELMAIWRDELTITAELIARDHYIVAENAGEPVAFVAINRWDEDASIEHLWVLPAYIGHGLGRRLLTAALDWCEADRRDRIRVVADPHAADFYRRFGAVLIGDVLATPAPRRLPLLEFRRAGGDPTRGTGAGEAPG